MVSGARFIDRVLTLGGRVVLFVVVFWVGFLTLGPFFELNDKFFEFQNPSGFFVASWGDWVLAWALSSILWAGIVFLALGKKIDYILFGLVVLFGIWNYVGTDNVTPNMYLA